VAQEKRLGDSPSLFSFLKELSYNRLGSIQKNLGRFLERNEAVKGELLARTITAATTMVILSVGATFHLHQPTTVVAL
jgi:hypothetical protein